MASEQAERRLTAILSADVVGLYSDAVNVASRLEGLAQPGGISISDDVRHQVQRKLALELEDLGEQVVKNIPDPVRVYRVREAGAVSRKAEPVAVEKPVGRERLRARTTALVALAAVLLAGLGWWTLRAPLALDASPIRAIAVLPLENLSGDPGREKPPNEAFARAAGPNPFVASPRSARRRDFLPGWSPSTTPSSGTPTLRSPRSTAV